MSIGNMGRPTAKFRLWLGQPVNAPHVTPPFSLRTFMLLSIFGAFAPILYGLSIQLRPSAQSMFSTAQLVGIAVFYFLVPICTAITISNNRKSSRFLALLYAVSIAYFAFNQIRSMMLSSAQTSLGTAAILLASLGVSYWLFLSRKLRVYYALISGRQLPPHLQHNVVEIMRPGRFEQRFSKVGDVLAPFFEYLLLLIAIFVAIAGLWII